MLTVVETIKIPKNFKSRNSIFKIFYKIKATIVEHHPENCQRVQETLKLNSCF